MESDDQVCSYRKKSTDIDAFYNEMETAGGSSTIPDREVTCYARKPISRNTGYDFEDGEPEELLKDDRVVAIEPQEILDSIQVIPNWTQSSSNWDKGAVSNSSQKNWENFVVLKEITFLVGVQINSQTRIKTVQTTSSGKNVDV